MRRIFPSNVKLNSSTRADRVFWVLCTITGLCFESRRNSYSRILCIFGLIVTAAVSFCSLPWWFYKEGTLTSSSSVILLAGVISKTVTLRWKILFIREYDSFEFILRSRGRRSTDLLPFLSPLFPKLVLTFKILSEATTWWVPFCEMTHLFYTFSMSSFLMLYADAITKILGIQNDLMLSLENLDSSSDADSLIPRKWLIRDLTAKVNALFARFMVVFYFKLLTTVILLFNLIALQTSESTELYLTYVWIIAALLQILLTVRKCSTVNTNNLRLESYVFKLAYEESRGIDANFLSVFRVREEFDDLKVGTFTIDIQNFLKYLTFCVTIVAIVLQFDYRIVRQLNNSNSSEWECVSITHDVTIRRLFRRTWLPISPVWRNVMLGDFDKSSPFPSDTRNQSNRMEPMTRSPYIDRLLLVQNPSRVFKMENIAVIDGERKDLVAWASSLGRSREVREIDEIQCDPHFLLPVRLQGDAIDEDRSLPFPRGTPENLSPRAECVNSVFPESGLRPSQIYIGFLLAPWKKKEVSLKNRKPIFQRFWSIEPEIWCSQCTGSSDSCRKVTDWNVLDISSIETERKFHRNPAFFC